LDEISFFDPSASVNRATDDLLLFWSSCGYTLEVWTLKLSILNSATKLLTKATLELEELFALQAKTTRSPKKRPSPVDTLEMSFLQYKRKQSTIDDPHESQDESKDVKNTSANIEVGL
jgi:hypothetical protein